MCPQSLGGHWGCLTNVFSQNGAIQVLRNAVGVGGCPDFRDKNVTTMYGSTLGVEFPEKSIM